MWYLRDVHGRLWHDVEPNQLRNWVGIVNAASGIALGYCPDPFRSEEYLVSDRVPRKYP